eukprot:CAMPEP_0194202850 /NCGR_PEP_ID=MMETSP0156-20130528/2770_1 /TAXON_ID=33649 /ORGANISM="Thalassionema nitzschioides, Strain L26-B" /LENGTH=527 /DNA_ID=CAMNT_0038928455 /DNA_START=51 /DNA_END=1634 /DNA_ORIENTATION=+
MSSETAVVEYKQADAAVEENEQKYEDVKNFNEYTKVTRKSLELWITYFQNQLGVLNFLAEKSDEEKEDFLFDLIDKDKNGHISAIELVAAFRANNAGMIFKRAMEKAITYVAMYDADNDATLDREEFKNFLARVTSEAESTFHDMCEYILMNVIFSPNRNTAEEDAQAEKNAIMVDEIVKKKGRLFDALSDTRMMDLFTMFDQDGNDDIDFQEVANGFYKLKDTFEKSTQEVVQIMVMNDRDHDRTLDYNEFTKLILSICAAGQMKFEDVADAFIEAVSSNDGMDEYALELANELYVDRQDLLDELKEEGDVDNVLAYVKMDMLFDIWDSNDDGSISYEELTLGLRKYLKTSNLVAMTEETLFTILEFDRDENQKLEKKEFALFLVKFAEKAKKNIYELIDFLAALSVVSENDEAEEDYIRSISDQADAQIKAVEEFDPNAEAATAAKATQPGNGKPTKSPSKSSAKKGTKPPTESLKSALSKGKIKIAGGYDPYTKPTATTPSEPGRDFPTPTVKNKYNKTAGTWV